MSLIGIDVGSSAVKAGAYRESGAPLSVVREAVTVRHPAPGAWEADPEEVWAATERALCRLAAHQEVRRDPPKALAVSASGREVFPATAGGRPLGPCLRTGDARTADPDAARLLASTPEQWIRACGHVPDRMDPTNRLLWWRQRRPEAWARARRFLNWHDLVTLRLVGRAVTDPALAAGFLLYDLQGGDWSAERLAALDLDRRLLPEVRPWASSLGPVGRRAAGRLGLPAGCVVVVGSFDTSCAAVGAGAVSPGVPLLACGSWESLVAPATRPRPRALAAAGLAVGPHPSLTGTGVFARSPNGTAAVDWARRLTGVGLRSLDRRLAATGPDPSPVLAVPHLSGAITPWAALEARGALLGLTLASCPVDVVKAVLEGIACDLALTFQSLESAGVAVVACRTAGGGARSRWWMQLKADLCGVPVEVVADAEAGALGAALLAGLGAGVFASMREASLARLRTVRRHEPDPARGARYAERLGAQRRLVPALLDADGRGGELRRVARRRRRR
jgi:xylulokinase